MRIKIEFDYNIHMNMNCSKFISDLIENYVVNVNNKMNKLLLIILFFTLSMTVGLSLWIYNYWISNLFSLYVENRNNK